MIISSDSVVLQQAKNSKRLNLNKLRRSAIESNKEYLEQLNRDQIRVGKANDGSDQAEYKSGSYADYKAELSTYLAPSPIADLYLTGSFVNQLFLKITGDVVVFDSLDSKSDDLQAVWRPMFGLTPISLELAKVPCTNEYVKLVYEKISS